MKTLKRMILRNSIGVSLLISVIITHCASSDITTALTDGYPVIRITGPAGNPVTISPIASEKGSLGVRLDTDVHWVTGLPRVTVTSEKDTIQYFWMLGDTLAVMMTLVPGTDVTQVALGSNPENRVKEWFINLGAGENEYLTGLFERVVDGPQSASWEKGLQTALNLRGQQVDMKLKPTVSAYAPFYLSSAGYGFSAAGTWPGVFDFCKGSESHIQISFEGPDLNFKLWFGTPLDITRAHALETGPSFVPPEWAFGPWRWRDEHNHRKTYYDGTPVNAPYNSELVEDVLMMKAFGIPCTAHWLDRPWAKGPRGYDDFEFDPARFPNAEKMIQWLNQQDLELMLWIAPWVMGDMAVEAVEKQYTLKSRSIDTVQQELVDFTNPEARRWWSAKGPQKLAQMGIKGFKLDRADGEKGLDSLTLTTHSGISYRENYNDYPHQFVKTTYDAVQPLLGSNFILYPRAQYTGSARYGGLWAGDTDGRPEGLRSAIIGMQRCAVMGYPVWGSDTGGYWGDFSRETCMRWLAFSCFSPVMEVGPTNNRGFWDNPDTPQYDTELIAVWRLYSIIRMTLQSTIHSLAENASLTGTPIVRPLFLMVPDQKEAWTDWQTFLLGDHILVSAVWEPGQSHHQCYLPAGSDWVDAWDNQIHRGGQFVTVETPIHKIPVFIRKGAAISLGNLTQIYEASLKIAAEKPDIKQLEAAEIWE